jgi:hypothetical protein
MTPADVQWIVETLAAIATRRKLDPNHELAALQERHDCPPDLLHAPAASFVMAAQFFAPGHSALVRGLRPPGPALGWLAGRVGEARGVEAGRRLDPGMTAFATAERQAPRRCARVARRRLAGRWGWSPPCGMARPGGGTFSLAFRRCATCAESALRAVAPSAEGRFSRS